MSTTTIDWEQGYIVVPYSEFEIRSDLFSLYTYLLCAQTTHIHSHMKRIEEFFRFAGWSQKQIRLKLKKLEGMGLITCKPKPGYRELHITVNQYKELQVLENYE